MKTHFNILKGTAKGFASLRMFSQMRLWIYDFLNGSLIRCFTLFPPARPHTLRYVITELLQSDLHKIIVSPQHLSADHIKVFLYQILRGLKYLHSARILHRDIKPGNLLVNSNCVLKICDFGLARVEEPDQSKHMTQEVVTQYYRAPEILMGARHYSAAVDVWSVGCIFGELLGRRILFQAQSPVQQVSFEDIQISRLLFNQSDQKLKFRWLHSWNWSPNFWGRPRWRTWGMRATAPELTCSDECQSSHHYRLCTP